GGNHERIPLDVISIGADHVFHASARVHRQPGASAAADIQHASAVQRADDDRDDHLRRCERRLVDIPEERSIVGHRAASATTCRAYSSRPTYAKDTAARTI